MKNLLLYVSAFMLLATSCQKQREFYQDFPTGKEVSVTVDATTLVNTRGTNPAGLTYYLEAYYNGERYKRYTPNTKGIFNIRLVSDIEYNLVAWADYDADSEGGFYNTEKLSNVTLNKGMGYINDESRDAFSGQVETSISKTTTINMTLGRPFARINVDALDLDDVAPLLHPNKATWTYSTTVYQTFDATTGNVGVPMPMTISQTQTFADAANGKLAFDYLFAPATSVLKPVRSVANFTLDFLKGSEIITSYDFSNIPYERNFQTNITGNLFTKEGNIDITVDDAWEDDITITYVGSDDVVSILGGIDYGEKVTLYLNQDIEAGAVIKLHTINKPADINETEINLILGGEIKKGGSLALTNGSYQGLLNLTVGKSSPDGVINLKPSGAIINVDGTEIGTLQLCGRSDAINSVGKGLKVNNFYPNGCPVYVYGTVGAFYGAASQFQAPYIVVGQGSDRKDMTVAEAQAQYVTSDPLTYAGVVKDGIVY